MRHRDISSPVSGNKTRYFRPKHDLSPTLFCSFVLCPSIFLSYQWKTHYFKILSALTNILMMFLARHKLYFHALHSVKVCDLYFVGYYEDVSRFRWRSLRVCNIVFVLCSYLSFNVTCVVCLLLRFSNEASRCSRVKVFFLLIKSSTVQESQPFEGRSCSVVW